MCRTEREMTYDLMKGLAILLMIAAHLVFNKGAIRSIIYSFHMPLFFILAGYFAKDIKLLPSFSQYTIKNAKRLLLPYLVTMILLCVIGLIRALYNSDISYVFNPILSMLSASADGWKTSWGLIYIGPLWFLIALFLVRELFYFMQCVCVRIFKHCDEFILGISISISICSVLIRPHMPSLPFSIMQTLTAIAFYALGYYLHRHILPWWLYCISVLIWPFATYYGNVDLANCVMKYYPISFIGACGGTLVVYLLCKGLILISSFINSAIYPIIILLAWCGMYSLPILCMHDVEMSCNIPWHLVCNSNILENILGGVFAVAFAYVIIQIPYLNTIFK